MTDTPETKGCTMNRLAILFVSIALASASMPSPAAWHTLTQVTKVTVFNGAIYVRGSGASGDSCTDYNNFYGTLYSPASDSGYKEYYALALTAQLMQKGLVCHVYSKDASGVCRMENCYIQ